MVLWLVKSNTVVVLNILRSVSTKCCLVYCLHNCCFSVWVRFSLPLAVFGFDSPWKRPGRFSAFADSRFPPPMMDSPLASFPLPQKSVIWLRRVISPSPFLRIARLAKRLGLRNGKKSGIQISGAVSPTSVKWRLGKTYVYTHVTAVTNH